ncbi:MAG: response regulator transcription factor [Sedimentitalea sp.]|uniref:response regulator transcription factor n=1 Tax=Sedimentitalea sp. TaxID=2048915 RepID=UPI003267858E
MKAEPETDQGHRILIVEDDEELATQTRSFLEERGYDVEWANSVGPARKLISQNPYDLYLLDIMMPGVSGKVLCREIAETSRSGIIMASSVTDDVERIALLELGADDYIVKPYIMLELLARIRAFFRRSQVGDTGNQRPTRFGPWRFVDDERHLQHDDGRLITLTSSEAQVIRYFLTNPGLVCSREDLLAIARVRQHGGTGDRSVDTLIRRLRTKIEPDPADPVFIETVWGQGYAFRSG